MDINKKNSHLYLIGILCASIISLGFLYFIFFVPPKIKGSILEFSIFEIYPPPEVFRGFNYPKLLSLMEDCRKIALDWGHDFYEFTSNKENKIKIDKLIDQFKEENFLFNKYYRNIRFNRRYDIPEQQRKALLYYSYSIENSIKELQELSRKFDN
ncbi:MAG: hypothetical protein ABIA74_00935 [bacterium]